MKVGVVIPSRLQERPGGLLVEEYGPELWLDGALANVRHQVGYSEASWEIFVGVDPRAIVPLHVYDYAHVVRGEHPGQAGAVNAAARAAATARSDVLLFLEDDDRWDESKARVQLPLLEDFPFASCSQELVSETGIVVGVNDYPVPSGWAVKTHVWWQLCGFSEDFRWLVDTEWLGRLSQLKVRRAHVVGRDVAHRPSKLGYVSRFSEVVRSERLLVSRTVNARGGMARISKDRLVGREADDEAARIRAKFGYDPW